jgi:hypothetical protein
MSNSLYKEVRVTYDPGTPAVPGTPGRAGSPERLVYETRHVCGLEPAWPGHWEYVITGYTSTRVWVPDTPMPGVGVMTFNYVCHDELVPVHVPAVAAVAPTPGTPGSAATLSTDYNLGWNSSSRSISFFNGDGYVEFYVPESTVGAVVGLNNVDVTTSYVDIDHGFYVTRGVARVYENGVEKAYLGFIGPGRYRVERVAGVVRYYVDGALLYTSALASTGTVFLDSSLYSGGDLVDTPALGGLSSSGAPLPRILDPRAPLVPGALALLPLQISGGDAYASASLVLARPVAFGGVAGSVSPNIDAIMQAYASGTITEAQMYELLSVVASGNLLLAPLSVFAGDHAKADALVTLAPMTIDGGAALAAPPYALASLATAYLQVSGTGQQGAFGGADLALLPVILLASDHAYAAASLPLQPLTAYGFTYEGPLDASVLSGANVSADLVGAYDIALVMRSDMTIAAVLAVQSVLSETMPNSLSVDAALAAIISQLGATMTTPLSIATTVPPTAEDAQVWVLNMDSQAVSTYEGFGFNSFAKFDGAYFGCKDDGVFTLEGNTDAGALIRASVNYGKLDFGSNFQKQPVQAYLGVSSTGVMYVKVTVGGVAYTYAARSSSATLATHRVDFGKGLKANYIQFEVYNKNGGDFELDSVEFKYVELTRRI